MVSDLFSLLVSRSSWFGGLLVQHVAISFLSIALAGVIGLALGIAIALWRRGARPVLALVNFVYTIPSIALLGFLIPVTGVGNVTAVVALTVYALLPMVRNTYTGIANIEPQIIEAARGMGATENQLLYRIELPLAAPVIMSGVRNMATMTIALAGIASFIGAGGLGVAIYRGITTNNLTLTLAGSLLIAVLAIVVDALLGLAKRLLRRPFAAPQGAGAHGKNGLHAKGANGLQVAQRIRSMLDGADASSTPGELGGSGALTTTTSPISGLATSEYSSSAAPVKDTAHAAKSAAAVSASSPSASPPAKRTHPTFRRTHAWSRRGVVAAGVVAVMASVAALARFGGLRLGDNGVANTSGGVFGANLSGASFGGSGEPDSSSIGITGTTGTIQVATKPMTEQYVLGEMLKALIEHDTSLTVEVTQGVGGGVATIQPALEKGDFDLYPEYTGTGWSEVLKHEEAYDESLFDTLRSQYETDLGLTWVGMYGFNNTYGLAVLESTAERLGLSTYSDLAREADQLTLGAEPDFFDRQDGYPGLSQTYDMEFAQTMDMDIGLKYQALFNGQVDAIVVFTTDGQLAESDVTVLEDDQGFYPSYRCGNVVRLDTLDEYPELRTELERLEGTISDADMARMNRAVETDGSEPKDVAVEFLAERGLM